MNCNIEASPVRMIESISVVSCGAKWDYTAVRPDVGHVPIDPNYNVGFPAIENYWEHIPWATFGEGKRAGTVNVGTGDPN